MSSYQGNGTFTISGTGLPYVTGTTISSTTANQLNSDLATGLSTALCKDGQSTPTANIKMGGFKIIGLGNGTASTDAAAYGQIVFPAGLLSGLTLSAAGSTGTFGIAAGSATDSTNVANLVLASAFTKTTATWASGTGNGGIDTGSIANTTWYHVFLIGGGANTVDVLFSLSPTSPTLPGTYTLFRRIGSMETDSSAHWVKFLQYGNLFYWDVMIEDQNSTFASSAAILWSLSTPSGIKCTAKFNMQLDVGASSETILLTCPDQTDTASSGSASTVSLNTSTYQRSCGAYDIETNTSSQIRARASTGVAFYRIYTFGWIDTRGQG